MTVDTNEPASIIAELTYFKPPEDGSRPYTNIYVDVRSREGRNWTKVPHYVQIENLRGREDSVSLDVNGFQFFKGAAKHTSFTNEEEVKAEYYPESIELVKKLTGASRIVPFDHSKFTFRAMQKILVLLRITAIRRRRPDEIDDGPTKRQPVPLVHVDQTPSAAAERVHMHTSAEDAPQLLKKRFQIINFWRPISHPAYDWPLALCDYSSIDYKKDLIPSTLRYPNREGENFGVSFNENHRWKYLRGMTPDECVLIKWYVPPAIFRVDNVLIENQLRLAGGRQDCPTHTSYCIPGPINPHRRAAARVDRAEAARLL